MVCSGVFYAVNDYENRGFEQKYCSKDCWNVRGKVVNKCLICKKEFITYRSVNKKTCSKKCWTESKKAPRGHSNDSGYSAIHKWMTAKYGKPKKCDNCNLIPNNPADIHWANISKEYRRDRDDWKHLCRWCHLKYDGNDIKSNRGRAGQKAEKL